MPLTQSVIHRLRTPHFSRIFSISRGILEACGFQTSNIPSNQPESPSIWRRWFCPFGVFRYFAGPITTGIGKLKAAMGQMAPNR
jgi:hypothetical protein